MLGADPGRLVEGAVELAADGIDDGRPRLGGACEEAQQYGDENRGKRLRGHGGATPAGGPAGGSARARDFRRFPGLPKDGARRRRALRRRSEEHTSELQSLMRISYAVLCL